MKFLFNILSWVIIYRGILLKQMRYFRNLLTMDLQLVNRYEPVHRLQLLDDHIKLRFAAKNCLLCTQKPVQLYAELKTILSIDSEVLTTVRVIEGAGRVPVSFVVMENFARSESTILVRRK